jgi:hypothetical protein
MLTFWLRGGVTIFSSTYEPPAGGGDSTVTGTQLTLDPALMLTPAEHVGILIYPAVDFGLTGNWEDTDGSGNVTTGNYKFTSYGLAAGLTIML